MSTLNPVTCGLGFGRRPALLGGMAWPAQGAFPGSQAAKWTQWHLQQPCARTPAMRGAWRLGAGAGADMCPSPVHLPGV